MTRCNSIKPEAKERNIIVWWKVQRTPWLWSQGLNKHKTKRNKPNWPADWHVETMRFTDPSHDFRPMTLIRVQLRHESTWSPKSGKVPNLIHPHIRNCRTIHIRSVVNIWDTQKPNDHHNSCPGQRSAPPDRSTEVLCRRPEHRAQIPPMRHL